MDSVSLICNVHSFLRNHLYFYPPIRLRFARFVTGRVTLLN